MIGRTSRVMGKSARAGMGIVMLLTGSATAMFPQAKSAGRAGTAEPALRPGENDSEWAIIDLLLKWDPNALGLGALDGLHTGNISAHKSWLYRTWDEAGERLFRQVGLEFYDAHPNDPRRWQWLAAMLLDHKDRTPPKILQTGALREDSTQQRLWKERLPELKAAFLASPAITDAQKMRLRLVDFADAEYQAMLSDDAFRGVAVPYWIERESKENMPYDVARWAKDFGALMALNPKMELGESDYNVMRTLVQFIILQAGKDSVVGPAAVQQLRQIPHPVVQALFAAEIAIADARQTPMAMRFTALDGRTVDFAQLRGKVVLVDFSAYTWCGACKLQEPKIKALYEKYHAQGLEIISFALEMSPKDRLFVEQYLREHQIAWPHYFDGKGMKNQYAQRFGVWEVPHAMLFDKQGLLVSPGGGDTDSMEHLEPLIRRQLGLAPNA